MIRSELENSFLLISCALTILGSYLATKHDVDVLVRGMKLCLRLARTEPLASVLDNSETNPDLDHALLDSGDANIEQEVRKRIETLYHPTSTARMAPLEEGGVVDAYLRVYGIDGLRVVDASVFPTIIAGHTVCLSNYHREYLLIKLLIGCPLDSCRRESCGYHQEADQGINFVNFFEEICLLCVFVLWTK